MELMYTYTLPGRSFQKRDVTPVALRLSYLTRLRIEN